MVLNEWNNIFDIVDMIWNTSGMLDLYNLLKSICTYSTDQMDEREHEWNKYSV